MERSRGVRYLRCAGALIKQYPLGTERVVIRIERDDGRQRFAGDVALNVEDEVIEESSNYGIDEGDVSVFDAHGPRRSRTR